VTLIPSAVVIVDALDECADGRTPDIIRILASMIPELRGVKFLITSRPEFPIRAQFRSQPRLSTAKHFVLHDTERSTVQSDIKLFLNDQFKDIHGRRFVLTEKQLDTLVDKSAGVFIYASTAVNFVKAQYGRPPKDLLELLLGDRMATDAAPYGDLDYIYMSLPMQAYQPTPF
jgi:predicted NACHT family NTPase